MPVISPNFFPGYVFPHPSRKLEADYICFREASGVDMLCLSVLSLAFATLSNCETAKDRL